jgi:hypothetical protein
MHLRCVYAACYSGNQFNGSLPAAWANWPSSQPLLLQLSENQLTGTLPVSWGTSGTLRNFLQALDLHTNSLNGTIPASWVSMTNLTCWSLANNQDICGAAPSGMVCPNMQLTYIGGCTLVAPCRLVHGVFCAAVGRTATPDSICGLDETSSSCWPGCTSGTYCCAFACMKVLHHKRGTRQATRHLGDQHSDTIGVHTYPVHTLCSSQGVLAVPTMTWGGPSARASLGRAPRSSTIWAATNSPTALPQT